MRIVRFVGGLGNQMFQYAFYKILQERCGTVKADIGEYQRYSIHNGFELERVFNIKLKYASRFEINLMDHRNREWKYRKMRRILFFKPKFYEEQSLFSYDPTLFDDMSIKIFSGFWQNHKYLNLVADNLKRDFIFPEQKLSQNLSLLEKLEKQQNSIAVHVRRGDYINDPYLGGLVNQDYFKKSISFMRERLSEPKFYIFSDDIQWCKRHLSIPDATYINWNLGFNSYCDMQLISSCKHAIISNSSFSWWGSWLIPNPKKLIIVPKKWWRGSLSSNAESMHPKEWVMMDNLESK